MNLKNEIFWVAGIACVFLLALALRLHNLDQPFEVMESRQTQTAEIARNLIQDSFNVFLPRVNRYGPDNPYLVLEFPLFNLIVALSARMTGLPLEPLGRFWSALFSLAGAWIWVLLLKKHYPVRAIFPGMIFYLFTFIGITTGRSFQPDALSLFWYLWILFELDACYAKNNFSSARWRLGMLTALACLTKAPMAVLLIVPLAALLWRNYVSEKTRVSQAVSLRNYVSGKTRVLQTVSFLFVCFVPLLLWTAYGGWIHSRFPNPVTGNYQLGNWFKPELFFSSENFDYYLNLWLQFRYAFLTSRSEALDWIVGLILLVAMGYLFRDAGKRKFFLPILFSMGLYYFLFNFHTATHFYYHLPLLPLLAVGLTHLSSKLTGVSFFGLLAAVLTVSLVNVNTALNYAQDTENAAQLIECADIVRRVVPENSLLLTSMDDESKLQYYSNRVGWIFIIEREHYKKFYKIAQDVSSFNTDPVEAMKKYIASGAEYYANCNPERLNRYPRFSEYLVNNFETVYSAPEKLLIFKLKSGPVG